LLLLPHLLLRRPSRHGRRWSGRRKRRPLHHQQSLHQLQPHSQQHPKPLPPRRASPYASADSSLRETAPPYPPAPSPLGTASTLPYRQATTTALKRLFENNSTTNKDIIKPFSDLRSTHFILPPLRFSHSSSFYHRSWCENRPFSPPCLATWPNHTKNPKNTPKRKLALPPSNLIKFLRTFGSTLMSP